MTIVAAGLGLFGHPVQAQVYTDSVRPRPVVLDIRDIRSAEALPSEERAALSPSEIARSALPAVVEIRTYRASGERRGSGSGFLLAPEGLVATSHHVLEGAHRAEVVLSTGDVFQVQHVAAADSRRDLVILRIAGFDLPVLRLGDSRDVEVGDPIVAIGSPLGLFNTVTHGLVSAKRELEGRQVLQISAPISVGSSGGPVFDQQGRVIGILAGFMRRGQNVNFAVPIEYARGLLALPEHPLTVEAVGRRRVSLIGESGAIVGGLSLSSVLHGESVPGEEDTPWARQPRWVNPEHVKADPITLPAEIVGTWELRELSRVRGTRSGVYRGVLVADDAGFLGTFFGTLMREPAGDPAVEEGWVGDRIRDFDGDVERTGRVTLRGEHGCRYFLHASPTAMTGVYECTENGKVYDLGAVEMRRGEGDGPTGLYDVTVGVPLGAQMVESEGRLAILALADGRFVGAFQRLEGTVPRATRLRDGRWTSEGALQARLGGRAGASVEGTWDADRIELAYPVGGRDYPVLATVRGERMRPEEPDAVAPAADTVELEKARRPHPPPR